MNNNCKMTVVTIMVFVLLFFELINLSGIVAIDNSFKNGIPMFQVPAYATIDYMDGFFVVHDGAHITVYESKK